MKFVYMLCKFLFRDDVTCCFLAHYRIAKLGAFDDFVVKASGEIGEPILHTKHKLNRKTFFKQSFPFFLNSSRYFLAHQSLAALKLSDPFHRFQNAKLGAFDDFVRKASGEMAM